MTEYVSPSDLSPFNVDNPHEWGLIERGTDIAPFFGSPIAVQVVSKVGAVQMLTGILSGTADYIDNKQKVGRTILYFRDADGVSIDWTSTEAVAVMFAESVESEGDPNG